MAVEVKTTNVLEIELLGRDQDDAIVQRIIRVQEPKQTLTKQQVIAALQAGTFYDDTTGEAFFYDDNTDVPLTEVGVVRIVKSTTETNTLED